MFKACSQIQGPALTFQLHNGKFFEVPRSSLLIDGSMFKIDFDGIEDYCVIGLATSVEDQAQTQITLGARFMSHYYAVIDHENQSYGFALSVGSRGYITETFASNVFLLIVFFSVLGVLILTLIIAFTLAKCRQMRWEKKLKIMRQMADPNYLERDGESLERKSIGSKKGSFTALSNRSGKLAQASFNNEFAY